MGGVQRARGAHLHRRAHRRRLGRAARPGGARGPGRWAQPGGGPPDGVGRGRRRGHRPVAAPARDHVGRRARAVAIPRRRGWRGRRWWACSRPSTTCSPRSTTPSAPVPAERQAQDRPRLGPRAGPSGARRAPRAAHRGRRQRLATVAATPTTWSALARLLVEPRTPTSNNRWPRPTWPAWRSWRGACPSPVALDESVGSATDAGVIAAGSGARGLINVKPARLGGVRATLAAGGAGGGPAAQAASRDVPGRHVRDRRRSVGRAWPSAAPP